MKRFILILIMLVPTMVYGANVEWIPKGGTISCLIAEKDAFTMQDMPNNYGGNPSLHHNGWYGGIKIRNYADNYNRKAYLMFDLCGIPPGSISSAILRLYHPRSGTNSLIVSSIENDSWTEEGINWNNAPSPGSPSLATQPIIQGWNEFDVTTFVKTQTDDKASFNLTLLNLEYNSTYFISREGRTDWRPQLVITHTSDVIPPPEPPGTSTSSLPWNSIWLVHNGIWTEYTSAQTACNNAQPGDEVVFGPGRYYQVFDVKKSNITIRGDGKPRPCLDASGGTSLAGYGRGVIGVGRQSSERVENITIENLEIKDASSVCGFVGNASSVYVVYATNTTIRDCYIHHNGNGIFVTKEAVDYLQEYCDVAYNSYVGSGYEHGHYFEAGGTTTVRYNHIHHNGGQGYKDRCQNTILAYNYIHDSGNYEVDFVSSTKHINPQNALAIGNIIKKSPSSTNQYQIIVFGENRHGGTGKFINNTIIANASTNNFFNIWNNYDRIEASNNIFHPNGFNNLSIVKDSSDEPLLTGTNNWLSSNSTKRGSLTSSVLGIDPELVNVNSDFHLLSTSACIDAGDGSIVPLPDKEYFHSATFTERPIDERIDIGAYEFLSEETKYPLIIHCNPENGGTVTLNPGGGLYNSGSTVTLTAVASWGWRFDSWMGDLSGNTNPITITMDGTKTVTANFILGSVIVYHFDGSLIGTFSTIQAGIDACPIDGKVVVLPGTYTEAVYINKRIAIIGAGTDSTIITAIGIPDTNTVTFDGYDANGTITGFIITGGIGYLGGAGIYCQNDTNPTIINNTISNNWWGIYCNNSSPTITNNIILESNYCSISCEGNSSPSVTNNTISGNGRGIVCWESSPTITNNTIAGNDDCGIYCGYLSSTTITNNTISENNGDGIICDRAISPFLTNNTISGNNHYGISCYISSPIITNSIISGNRWDGISCEIDSSPTITNNTISKNNGNGIYCGKDSSPTTTNNIITENGTTSSFCYGIMVNSGNPSIDYNDVWENGLTGNQNYYNCSAGANDISSDPEFISNTDFHPGTSSPCINKGSNTAPAIPPTDKDGNPRIVNGIVDMGAYEFQGEDTIPPIILHNPIPSNPVGLPMIIMATITDNFNVQQAILYWKIGGTKTISSTLMTNGGGDLYRGTIPISNITMRGLLYAIWATDGKNDTLSTIWTTITYGTVSSGKIGAIYPTYKSISVPVHPGNPDPAGVLWNWGNFEQNVRLVYFDGSNWVIHNPPDSTVPNFAPEIGYGITADKDNEIIVYGSSTNPSGYYV
ncbi:MAG: right-handed parallel beta-helix repeat-containing protein, partial [bacterium]